MRIYMAFFVIRYARIICFFRTGARGIAFRLNRYDNFRYTCRIYCVRISTKWCRSRAWRIFTTVTFSWWYIAMIRPSCVTIDSWARIWNRNAEKGHISVRWNIFCVELLILWNNMTIYLDMFDCSVSWYSEESSQVWHLDTNPAHVHVYLNHN